MACFFNSFNGDPTTLEYNTKPQNGQVYVMYHGTTKRKAKNIKKYGFQRSSDGMLGPGVYVSRDIHKASRYPIHSRPENRAVLELLVNVGRVKKIDRQDHPLQKIWHNYGYDTAWVPPKCGMVRSGQEEDCVWDPRRIQLTAILDPVWIHARAYTVSVYISV
uniref:PARP catalytic domain-containing protein n=1 Tax=Erpetoichthys calabaricus TaxID=27687 RepID=A0A8C4RMM6_ERPCA